MKQDGRPKQNARQSKAQGGIQQDRDRADIVKHHPTRQPSRGMALRVAGCETAGHPEGEQCDAGERAITTSSDVVKVAASKSAANSDGRTIIPSPVPTSITADTMWKFSFLLYPGHPPNSLAGPPVLPSENRP